MQVTCPAEFADPFKCPTKEDYLEQLLALLPRGRAWQSHDAATGTNITRYTEGVAECGEAQCGEAQCGQVANDIERTVLAAYWAAYAEVLEYFSQRACKLLDEFFCQTADETEDWWGIDYGFPDPCDPWDDLCEKVAAQGGSTCEYLTWAASRRGWAILCRDCQTSSGGVVADCAMADCEMICDDCVPNTLHITIDVANSPAFNAQSYPPLADCMVADCTSLCDVSPQEIECLIERIKPAHVAVIYHYI